MNDAASSSSGAESTEANASSSSAENPSWTGPAHVAADVYTPHFVQAAAPESPAPAPAPVESAPVAPPAPETPAPAPVATAPAAAQAPTPVATALAIPAIPSREGVIGAMNPLEAFAINIVLGVLQTVIKNPAHKAAMQNQLLGIAADIAGTYGYTLTAPPVAPATS